MALDTRSQILSDTARILFESSLQNLCMNLLIEKIRGDDELADYLRGNLIALPFRLRMEMLKRMEFAKAWRGDWVEMEKATGSALALMCNRIPSFNFESIESSGDPNLRRKQGKQQQVINKAYKLLAERHSASLLKLVHLHKLAIEFSSTGFLIEEPVSFAPRRFSYLLRLKNLECLHLTEYAISQQQFQHLCQTLVNLQSLSCIILDVTERCASAALKNLTKLEEFEFKASCARESVEPWNLCSHLLGRFPKLRIIGPRVNTWSRKPKASECHSLKNVRTWKEPSQLEHLSINQEITVEQARMVPNISALRISSKKCSFKYGFGTEAVMMLEKLKSLTVQGHHDWQSLHQLFEQIGSCLEEVTFDSAYWLRHEPNCVYDLLSFCPNMKILNSTCTPSGQTYASFHHLTKICIETTDCHSGLSLCQLFCPPKLEIVELWRIDIKDTELQDAVDFMGAGIVACSQKLREIKGSIYRSSYYDRIADNVQELWDQFFQLVCINLPDVKVFDFWRGTSDVPWWLTETMVERSTTVV